jgi:hypothetical protein
MYKLGCTSDHFWDVPGLIQYLAQNQNKSISIDVHPEAICLHNLGFYKILDCFEFESVVIHTWNPLETHPRYTIRYKGRNFWFDRQADITPRQCEYTGDKIFLCLYHRPTAGRLALAGHLHKNHADSSLIHFSTDTTDNNLVQFEFDKLLSWHMPSVENAAVLLPSLPILLGPRDQLTSSLGYFYTDPLTELYREILVDVVVESHVAGNTFFPTEKTVRPMLLGKPFVAFASCNYLAYLRQMGFRTFSDFWSEDYDGYEGRERLIRMFSVLDTIAAMTADQRETMYWDLQYTLQHNQKILAQRQWSDNITLI